MRHTRLPPFLLLAVTLGAALDVIAADLLDDVAGYYSIPAKRCSEFVAGELVQCGKEVRDCLYIGKKSNRTATVEMWTAQTNWHDCAAHGTATLVGRELHLMLDQSIEEDVPGQGLRITIGRKTITFSLIEEPSHGDPFCGARASVSRVVFPRKARSANVDSYCKNVFYEYFEQ